jgi:hypothetical protein
MEAAQTLQLRPTRVELRDDGVYIEGLLVEDRTLAELVARRLERELDPEETVLDALAIGARVLDREATGAEVDFVQHQLARFTAEWESALAERVTKIADGLEEQLDRFLGEDGGVMAAALDAHAEGLSELIAEHFGVDRNTAVQHQMKEAIAKLLSDSRQDLLRQFSAEDGHNPLADFKAAVVREVKRSGESQEKLVDRLARLEGEVRRLHDADEAAAELEAERERGTGKGRDFEQRVFELIEEIAIARGDAGHHVGDAPSASGGKRGDIVVEVDGASGPAKARIAFDAKDERLSKNDAWKVLNASLDDRDAAFAVLVVASDEKVPAGREQLHEYEGNKMVVALDKDDLDPRALELAYRYARCRALMKSERLLELDAVGVRDAAEEALSALRDAQRIRRSLTGATNSVTSAREALDTMVGRVEGSLGRIESLVAASEAIS